MEPNRLFEALRSPDAFPHPVGEGVEVVHTHISAVFLANGFVYKVKKPLDLGFLDFTTLGRRLGACRDEVRLNRRLAPKVYLGVVPIVQGGGGVVFLDENADVPHAEALDYAVKMIRLPDDGTLRSRLEADRLDPATLEALARRIASFHDRAESGPAISRYGRWEVVARNARDNLVAARERIGETLSSAVHDRLERALEAELERIRPLVEERAGAGAMRDTHGDLHLEHVYLFPERDPPDDLVIIDCIEFSERFRYADPVSDAAFLAMDLLAHGRRDLEERFSTAYVEATGDREGARLLPFYRAYRAAVRGKVQGLVRGEEVSAGERRAAEARARGHWLLALSELEGPGRRPGLVLVGGLPGSGKSTLAAGLARSAGFRLLSSDRTRKALAGVGVESAAEAPWRRGIYTPEWTRRTYDALLDEVRAGLFRGERVLVDASFVEEERRRAFLRAAREHGVRVRFLVCRASPQTIRDRLAARTGDPSDADWDVHRRMAERWDAPGEGTRRVLDEVDTGGRRRTAVARGLRSLVEAGLAEEGTLPAGGERDADGEGAGR